VDQCGACHDYMPQTAVGLEWPGAVPISRRVHNHFGSSRLPGADHQARHYPPTGCGISRSAGCAHRDTTCHQNAAGPGTNKTSGSWAIAGAIPVWLPRQ
jgi:hypothetical protein